MVPRILSPHSPITSVPPASVPCRHVAHLAAALCLSMLLALAASATADVGCTPPPAPPPPPASASSGGGHDCFWRDPKMNKTCNRPLLEDRNCTVFNATSIDAWQRMDCDIVKIVVPAKRKTNKWLVVHAGECDYYTEKLGDYFARDRRWNYFALRPCGGAVESSCLVSQNYDVCNMIHLTWTARPELVQLINQGFNPPELINAYNSDPNARFVFLHEFGDGSSYPWQHMGGCNMHDKPAFLCIAGDDPHYDSKWKRFHPLLHRSLNSLENFPCRVEVIDARNSTKVPGFDINAPNFNRFANISCSGMYPTLGNAGWAWEMQGKILGALKMAVLKAEATGKESKALSDYRKAIDIALEN